MEYCWIDMDKTTLKCKTPHLREALARLVAWLSGRGSFAICAKPWDKGMEGPRNAETTFPAGAHPKTEMAMLSTGRARLFTAGGFQELKPGRPVLIMPYALHAESYSRTSCDYKMLWVDITSSGTLLFISSYMGRGRRRKTLEERLHIESRETTLLWELCSKDGGKPPDGRTKARIHALTLLLACEALESCESQRPQSRAEFSKQAIRRALGFISRNFASPVSVPELARELRLSPNYLNSVFKRETGSSIMQCVIERRLEAAKLLLKEDASLSVKEAAAAAGFRDQLYFCRVFKARTGMTPTRYRESPEGAQA